MYDAPPKFWDHAHEPTYQDHHLLIDFNYFFFFTELGLVPRPLSETLHIFNN